MALRVAVAPAKDTCTPASRVPYTVQLGRSIFLSCFFSTVVGEEIELPRLDDRTSHGFAKDCIGVSFGDRIRGS